MTRPAPRRSALAGRHPAQPAVAPDPHLSAAEPDTPDSPEKRFDPDNPETRDTPDIRVIPDDEPARRPGPAGAPSTASSTARATGKKTSLVFRPEVLAEAKDSFFYARERGGPQSFTAWLEAAMLRHASELRREYGIEEYPRRTEALPVGRRLG